MEWVVDLTSFTVEANTYEEALDKASEVIGEEGYIPEMANIILLEE